MSVVGIECEIEDQLFQEENQKDLKGDDVQKLSVIQALPQLLQTEPAATYQRIIPKILQELPNSSCEFHIVTSKVFLILMEKSISVNLLNAVLQGIDSKDPIVSNCWMDTLLGVIDALNTQQIKQIIPLAHSKSLLNQPVHARISSCRIIGKLANHKFLDSNDVKRDLLPITQSLCQDCHPEVRKEMCTHLPSVAKGLGPSFMKTNLMVLLVELAADENSGVRSAALSATVQIFPLTPQDVKKTTLLPLVKQFCEKGMSADDITPTVVAKEIGKLMEGLQSVLSPSEMVWFLQCFKTLARRGLSFEPSSYKSMDTSTDVMCRHYCAQSLAPMASFTFSKMPSHIDFLYNIVKDLSVDPCYIVRRTIAKDFDEIVKIFSKGDHASMLKPEVIRMIRDDSEDVLHTIVPCLGSILNLFGVTETLSRQTTSNSTNDIGKALLKCNYELSKGNNWRLLTRLIGAFETLPMCMPPEYIHQNFTPVILNSALKARAKPVRTQSVRTLLVFLRYNNREMQRKWLRDSLVNNLCYSKNCYTRNIFVRMCANALEIFSKKYFKDYLYSPLLDLADDPVANIRLCVASLFCSLKEMLVYPQDKPLGDCLDKIFMKYAHEEKDRDVLEIYFKQMNHLRKTVGNYKLDLDKEEKRRQEEEEKIAGSASKMIMPIIRKQSFTKSNENLKSLDSGNLKSSSLSGSTSGASKTSVDLNFLQQHFYIDAGINLPAASTQSNEFKLPSSESSNLDLRLTKESKYMLEKLNITDDEKVTLRRLSKKENYRKNAKRHSSVISLSCYEENKSNKCINRLSLNLKPKEASKIPVFNKTSTNVLHTKHETNKEAIITSNRGANFSDIKSKKVLQPNGAILPVKTSNLPILLKKFHK